MNRAAAGTAGRPLDAERPKVWFVGAGPGAADLLTFRGAAAIAAADVVVWAGSLVSAELLVHARPGAGLLDSSRLTLEQVTAVYDRAVAERLVVARVHSGDPTLYGAIQEQIAECERRGLAWEIVPGVSSLAAAAAAVGRELTIPGVAQSVVLTRLATRTSSSMPPRERVRELARSGSTMAVFLSCSRPRALQAELQAGGYPPDTPCAVVYRASWPDEVIIRCGLAELAGRIRDARITKQALVLVGPALADGGGRSNLYHPAFSHTFRRTQAPESSEQPIDEPEEVPEEEPIDTPEGAPGVPEEPIDTPEGAPGAPEEPTDTPEEAPWMPAEPAEQPIDEPEGVPGEEPIDTAGEAPWTAEEPIDALEEAADAPA